MLRNLLESSFASSGLKRSRECIAEIQYQRALWQDLSGATNTCKRLRSSEARREGVEEREKDEKDDVAHADEETKHTTEASPAEKHWLDRRLPGK